MLEGLFYLMASFWFGAVHAATPGHGKTIAASYIVGVRGRPIDALVLGVFVTLSHTSGIILVAVLATFGYAWLIPQRVEAYLAVGTGILVVGIGCWMLRTQMRALALAHARQDSDLPNVETQHHHHGEDAVSVREEHAHPHPHAHGPAAPGPHCHSHGWGLVHKHDIEAVAQARPSLAMLLGLSVAGGLLPDPGALAIMLSAITSGKLILGLFTVLVFSLGFASVLVVVGVVAARAGQLVLTWLSSRWISGVQIGAALVIIVVGFALTVSALRTVATLR
jgi:nickel/cobalt transporter (NicO) family protein